MPSRIPIARLSTPARSAAPHLARQTLVVALLIAGFFAASVAVVHWLTSRPPPVVSRAPAPHVQHAERHPPTARPPDPVVAPSVGQKAPALAAWPPLPSPVGPVSSDAVSSIEISFKLDPRLTRSLHMGDRWVSPPTYTSAAQPGADVSIEARARARDSSGRAMKDVAPVWTAVDPAMVAISSGERGAVRLTVKRAGRSEVTVTSGDAARRLEVAAVQERGLWRVDIAQR